MLKKFFSFISFGKEEWVELFYLYKIHMAVIGVALIGGLAFLSLRLSKDTSADYYAMDLAYTELAQGKEKPELLKTIEQTLSAHPELHARYDAKLTQRLIERNQGVLLDRYSPLLLEKNKLDMSFYNQFANLSFTIAKGNFTKALTESKELKRQMEQEKLDGTILYAYQMLRIAMLEQQAGTPEQELLAWREFLQNKGDELLESHFRDQKLTLKDYIHHRVGHNI